MDAALDLLSGEEDDDEPAKSPPPDAEEHAAKRQKLGEAAPALDFSALRRAGYGAGDEEAERSAAEASLRGSFAALEKEVEDSKPKMPTPEKAKSTTQQAYDKAGCELPPDSVESFDELGQPQPDPWLTFDECEEKLHPQLVSVMRESGFKAPTPIQAHTWPILASGRDLIGVAKTGSGKTLAFLLPCFAALLREGLRPKTGKSDLPAQMLKQAAGPGAYSPEILVMAPSRELAIQIEDEAKKFTKATGISTLACYGGDGLRRQQLGSLRERPECVVATVGRLCDFIENEQHWFGVKNVRWLILDEADHMLGEGLNDKIRKITTDVETKTRQTSLFSATMDVEVTDLATWVTRNPVECRVGLKDPLRANSDIDQRVLIVKDDGDKDGALKTLLRRHFSCAGADPGRVLIFAGESDEAEHLSKKLQNALQTTKVEVLHGNLKQEKREKAMELFRSGEAPILVATNVAGRGLDVKDVNLVVNFDPPEDGMDYVHRIGRTARAGKKGAAVTLLRKGPDGRAMIFITQVMRRTGVEIPSDLISALKQRRGRDMGEAAEVLQGLVSQTNLQRTWAANAAR
jgi:ATP-dependent RNA helicase DDX5/DBP2